MKNMFGFSRRRTKLGRLKVQIGDPLQGTRSPARPTKSLQSNGENAAALPLPSGRSDDLDCGCSSGGFELNKSGIGNPENWMVLSTEGDEPAPRFNHAATIVGSKMVVVGGESGNGMLSDTMILRLDNLTWSTAAPKVPVSPNGMITKVPPCKGHCLVAWGKLVLLIGGRTDPMGDKVSVWSFNIETECWLHIEAKGDIPAARSGHTVIRAGPILILFGGEDAKGRKLNDMHMFDLKSSTWLPLHYTGTGPSPRSNHVAALSDDRTLLIFGGQSKSKILNDLYSLDFETMVWSRIKIRGHHPSPRAGCGGALSGTKWFIIGGGSKKKRHAEALILDVVKFECSVSVTSSDASVTINKGFTLIPVHYQDKVFLVAFGGNGKEPSNQVEILMTADNEHSMSWRSAPDTDPLTIDNYPESSRDLSARLHSGARSHSIDCVARQNLVSTVEQLTAGRKSLSDSFIDPNSLSGSVSLEKQFHQEEDYDLVSKIQKTLEADKCKKGNDYSVMDHRSKQQETTIQVDIARILASPEELPFGADPINHRMHQKQANGDSTPESDHAVPSVTDSKTTPLTNPSNIYQLYEAKIATLTRKNALLEGQLTAALANREAVEKNLSTAIKSKHDLERTLGDTVKEVEHLKDKLAGVELAQEEANSLSNIVHADNVRLEHDVAFLKAVLDETQKELHSTRGVLAGERARAFQLQVEVFRLKQRLQSLENRAPTPRKPYHM